MAVPASPLRHSLPLLALAVLSSMLLTRIAHADDGVTPTATRPQVARTVASQLREGNLDEALKSLATAPVEAIPGGLPGGLLGGLPGGDPIGAGLHRVLARLTSDARFDLLSQWTLPDESPATIRVYTALVPTTAPPQEFARVLGERPRDTSFPLASIGEVQGLFSTAWSLVLAARESGQLKRLIAEVGPLAEKQVPNGEWLLSLARIADGKGDLSKVASAMSQRVGRLKGAAPAAIDPSDVVMACAALGQPTLRPLGEELLWALLEGTHGQPNSPVRPFLRQAHALAVLGGAEFAGESDSASRLDAGLCYWIPVSSRRSGLSSPATIRAGWLVHDDHLLHVTGAGHDALLLRYPLQGDFEFQCDTQFGGRVATDGQLLYGGLEYQVKETEFRATGADGGVISQRPCPFVRPPHLSSFNRLSLVSTAGAATVSVNLHPQWTDKLGFRASPWLGLASADAARPLFRNLKLTGQPVIPRSVSLIEGPTLRGWQPERFGDPHTAESEEKPSWQLVDGAIGTTNGPPAEATSPPHSVLYYQRPLLDSETISFEFLYKPGEHDVSPTLGRLAFLLQPDGVRLRWLTGDDDWTGLPVDNNLVEPLNRRGPRPLPLRANEWNRAAIARAKGTVTLSLNGEAIYQRPIDWSGDQRFGLYRHNATSAVRVRNVVLTGDWPETLPREFLDNPLGTVREPRTVPHRQALNRLFQEEFLAENLVEVRRKAFTLPAAERFEYLSQWILPGPDHPDFRVSGHFTPTRPSPLARAPGVEHPELGGQIVSPAYDWIDVAAELGRLDECRQRVEAVPVPADGLQQRSRVALLLLIGFKQKNPKANDAAWEKLFGLVRNETDTPGENRWPEMLVIHRGAGDSSPDGATTAELVMAFATQRMFRWQQPDISRWQTHIGTLRSRIMRQREAVATTIPAPSTGLHQWIPATSAYARTAGSGHPVSDWVRLDHRVFKLSSHDTDYLYFHLPLSGNFQVECDLVQPTQHPVSIMVGGSHVGPRFTLIELDSGTLRADAPLIKLDPKLTDLPKPIRFRAVVQDGTRTVYLNGRNVLTTPIPTPPDPWIAIRCPGRHRASVEGFRVLGKPTVLSSVHLSRSTDLTGWLDYYEEGRWGYHDKAAEGNWIVGRSWTALAGSFNESLLRYHRPLVEDGSIRYEFFYEPGVVETSPALDRLAFLLHPSGVREHWVTDGKYGPVEVRPDNVTDVPANRRGPTQLPLKAGQWNQLVLTLQGANVGIQLNGELVYERVLEPLNQRTFGLFHYADATEARVRNVELRGDWPKELPPVAAQELAGTTSEWLDADLPRLKSVFTHDFVKGGLPTKYFEVPTPNPLVVTPEGVLAAPDSMKDPLHWEMNLRFALSGDFDIEASFAQARLEARTNYCGIMLRAVLDEPQKPTYDLHRITTYLKERLSQACVSFSEPTIPGAVQWRGQQSAWESDSGRLRMARRGTTLTYLIAEGDSETFRIVGTEQVSRSDTIRHGVRLPTFAFGGTTRVLWKSVILRAERMTWFPVVSPASVLLLKVVNADGSGVRTIAEPETLGFRNVGSPEWSKDGRKIVVDMSNGGTDSSYIVVMNADGTECRKLGPGCMPSFSADGGRIVFSQPGQGIMTMKSDGTDRQPIDRSGWGTQWSPDGKWIAYAKSGNITLLDVETRKSRQLIGGKNANRYNYIYYNLAWSHDSRGIAFKGGNRANNRSEFAFVEVNSPEDVTVLLPDASSTEPDLSFTPESDQVIGSINYRDGKGMRLHLFDIEQPGPPKRLDLIPANEYVDGVAWSRDGKSIAISVLNTAQPTEWVTGMKTD